MIPSPTWHDIALLAIVCLLTYLVKELVEAYKAFFGDDDDDDGDMDMQMAVA